MAFFRRPVRSRPIRLFLISMFVVPLVSLVALWAFAASITVSNAISDHEYNVSSKAIATGISALTVELPQERAQSYLWLIGGRTTSNASMLATRRAVDKGIPAVRTSLHIEQGMLSAASRSAQDTVLNQVGQLGRIRAAIDSGAMSPSAAFGAYSSIVDELYAFFDSATQDRGASLAAVSIGAVDAGYATEMAGREAALVGGALLDRGRMSAAARQQFASSAANRRLLMNDALALLTPSLRAGFLDVEKSPAYRQFEAMESQILAETGQNGPIPVNPGAWQTASFGVLASTQKVETENGTQLTAMSASLSDRLVTEAVLAGGLGLVAVIASVFLLVWFGRKVRGDLGRLDESVRSMASERLPRVVERLRRGEDVDVSAESPPPGTSAIQEISRIAESFGTVQGAAVAAAVDQAMLRKGVNQVFLNISMRNQSLLHRQLGMLDSMERRTSEPEALADLFRLDHLTTRMRRHAEGLIILSGSTPGRGWRDPVPVVDILRAAVAEVEDYVRVDVTSESDELVAGNAVNDVNRRLASTPEFDLAHSEQLGLFVVSHLAARHDIEVSLRRSVYGGTTAVVLMPFGVIVRQEEGARTTGDQGAWAADGGGRSLTGRHRVLPAVMPGPGPDADTRPGEREWPPAPAAPAGVTYPIAPWEAAPALHAPPALPARPALSARPELSARPALPARAAEAQAPPPPVASVTGAPPWDTEGTTPWHDVFQPGAPRPEPSPPHRPGAPAGSPRIPEPSGPASSGSHLGMPIRIPQASLAPPLQGRHGADPRAAQTAEPEVDARSPEATRRMMSLMQQGWRRGRVDDLDDPEGAPGDGTDR